MEAPEVRRSPNQVNPKTQQFLDELSELHKEIFDRYQLELVPILNVGRGGIVPAFGVKERVHERKKPKEKIMSIVKGK